MVSPSKRLALFAGLAAAGAAAGFLGEWALESRLDETARVDRAAVAPPAEMLPRPRWGVLVVVGLAVACAAALLGWKAFDTRRQTFAVATALTHGEPKNGPALIARYGCGGCHTIPGIPGADGKVGPRLESLRQQVYVGGVARNGGETLVRWIVDPQSLSPRSAMPATGISEAEARDVAAWLYTR